MAAIKAWFVCLAIFAFVILPAAFQGWMPHRIDLAWGFITFFVLARKATIKPTLGFGQIAGRILLCLPAAWLAIFFGTLLAVGLSVLACSIEPGLSRFFPCSY